MRKFFSLTVMLFVFGLVSFAQYDNKALEILDAMSSKYMAMNGFRAQFTYSIQNESSGIEESLNGEITVQGEKYKLKLPNQEIINNGTTVWTYLPEENEVNISNYEPTEDEITPSKIYTIYKKGYKYIFLEEKKEGGETYEIVDLIPEKKDQQIFKIRLEVNKKDKLIKKWKIFEKSGNRYEYLVTTFTPDIKVQDNFFAFDQSQYKGIEVVDLR